MKEVLPNWVKTTPFLRGGRGCMHMKVRPLFLTNLHAALISSPFNSSCWCVAYFAHPSIVSRIHPRVQLFYKTGRLRIVVSTANLIEIDWRDIENVGGNLLVILFGPNAQPS